MYIRLCPDNFAENLWSLGQYKIENCVYIAISSTVYICLRFSLQFSQTLTFFLAKLLPIQVGWVVARGILSGRVSTVTCISSTALPKNPHKYFNTRTFYAIFCALVFLLQQKICIFLWGHARESKNGRPLIRERKKIRCSKIHSP